MANLEKLKEIINNRIVFILLHGRSIEELERRITEFKDYDICYTSLNYFSVMEDCILSKINKKLDFVYDSSNANVEVRQDFNCKFRIPRLRKYLDRENGLWVTNKGMINVLCKDLGEEEFVIKYKEKIFLVDDLDIRLNVPNSLTLLLGISIIGGAKKVVIFGLDGAEEGSVLHTYYKQDLYIKNQKKPALGNMMPCISRDTGNFNHQILDILEGYCVKYSLKQPPILNCSPQSNIKALRTIEYNDLIKEIKK